ncbi:MAG: MBL fold metallo-hydrolase [Caldisericales bacterium]|nr:MBL fold metallo-hydrolase [Caldisericales bacterium]
MNIERFVTSFEQQNNTYLAYCPGSKEAIVVDPSFEIMPVIERIKELSLKVRFIVNTHSHFDHIAGNDPVKDATGAKLAIFNIEAGNLPDPEKNFSAIIPPIVTSRPADVLLEDGQDIVMETHMGPVVFKVLWTPGHSPGHICLKFHRGIFTGDAIFNGSIGRTDLPGGNMKDMKKSLTRLWNELPDDFEILPGHMETSTIAAQRRSNYLWEHMAI